MSSVMIDVPSVSGEEAPLVLRWHRYKNRHAGFPADGWSHPPFDYRRFDGDLFTPVFYQYSGRADHHVTLEEAIEAVTQGYSGRHNPLFAGEEFHRFPDDLRLRAEDLAGIARIRESDEDKIAAAIRGQASDLVSVDGQLFRRDPDSEPVYDLGHGYLDTKRLGSIKPEKRDIRTLFRVDQIAEVLDLAGALDQEAARGRPRSISTIRRPTAAGSGSSSRSSTRPASGTGPTRDRHSWPTPPRSCGATGTRSETPRSRRWSPMRGSATW